MYVVPCSINYKRLLVVCDSMVRQRRIAMRKTYILIICCIVLIMAGCENYDKAIQGIEKGREFIGNTEKKVAETKKEAEKSIGKIVGKETAKSDDNKSDEQEHKGGRREKEKKKIKIRVEQYIYHIHRITGYSKNA